MDRVIDSHLHLCLIARHHPDRIKWLVDHHCGVISWAYGGEIETRSDLEKYLAYHRDLVHELKGGGLDCFFLAGVHPRKIPADLAPEDIPELLSPYLEDPLCLGIGEIGLETGSAREQEVFLSQIEFGLSFTNRAIPIGIHTPRKEKEPITQMIFSLLEKYTSLHAVIDHLTLPLLGDALARGYYAGITLSPEKTSLAQFADMIAAFGEKADRIMANTDSNVSFFEDLVTVAESGIFKKDLAQNVFCRTAECFWGIARKNSKAYCHNGLELLTDFRKSVEKEAVDISDADFAGLRDGASGREVDL